jgi:hypothetical protein
MNAVETDKKPAKYQGFLGSICLNAATALT